MANPNNTILVGDLIQAIRVCITDQPQTLLPPTIPSVNIVSAPGSNLTIGNYFVVVTFRNPWGETLQSPEIASPVTVGVSQGIQIIAPAIPPGATVIRAYLTQPGGAAGTEQQWIESSVLPFTISTALTNSGAPPSRNTCFLPDTDGNSFNAAILFQWVNDALKLGSSVCGGLIDYSGVTTVSGVPMYQVPGQWESIPDVWYDGYPLAPDKRGNFFRRNSITASILSQVTTSILTDKMMLEVWPQPARSGASTTLANPMLATDTQAICVNIGGFLLTNGFCQIGTEICSYSQRSGNTLLNLIRGLSGTSPAQAWPAGTVVNELNLFFGGWRKYAPAYFPGQSFSTVPVPVGWETLIPIYGLARVKLAEQNTQEYMQLKKDFTDELTIRFKTNKVTTGPKQIGDTSSQLEVIPTLGGGWVIP